MADSSPRSGYLGDSHHSLRTREVFKYYQPIPEDAQSRKLSGSTDAPAAAAAGSNQSTAPPDINRDLLSSEDPVLTCLANVALRMLDCNRCIVTMVSESKTYVVCEATRSLSVAFPHTHLPGDQLLFGCGKILPSTGTLCEITVSLLPPSPEGDELFLFQSLDLAADPVFCNIEMVTKWPFARFYSSSPLRTRNGVSIGSLCCIDDKPKPDGLNEEQKMALTNMADIFMNYLQTKQGERDLKKGKVMEMGLSKFIAEGFLPGEGVEMTERRDGRLWSESILEQRRLKEIERKHKVEEKRLIFQERKFAEMVREREREWEREKERSRHQFCVYPMTIQKTIPKSRSRANSASGVPPYSPALLKGPPIEDPKFQESCPTISVVESMDIACGPKDEIELSLMETMIFPPSSSVSGPSAARGSFSGFRPDYLLTPPASAPRFNSKTEDHYFDASNSSALSSSSVSDNWQPSRRQSAYEKTSSFEPHYRAVFSRAATLIRDAIEADVVFLDGDLEGFFASDPEYCDRRENCGLSHISSDRESEAATRARRPKACRRRSGILGYATAGGSSTLAGKPDTVESLGFDVAELNEGILNQLVEENSEGRIVAHIDEPDAQRDPEESEGRTNLQTEAILKRFLPGAKSVILVPLVGRDRELFAVCFAWTCSTTRTFCGDVEGSFVSAVTNSIVAEATRLNILSADKAKGEFISSISHELRSPLHGILASAEFLAESKLDPYQRSFVDTVISCGTTLLDTINHVLDFQKLNYLHDVKVVQVSPENTAPSEPEEVHDTQAEGGVKHAKTESIGDYRMVDTDLSSLVQDIADGVCMGAKFHSLASSEGKSTEASATVTKENGEQVTVIVDIDQRTDGWVFYTHPAALKRILNNIAGNAMKYTESGWVRVSLRADDIPCDEQGNERAAVEISVSDSGKGISREFLKTKLFTPFSQENPLAAGAGLGMSIVRQIVDVLNGKIDVRSQVGKGTQVTVRIPLIHRVVPAKLNLDPATARCVDEVLNVRTRTRGVKIRLVGFETSQYIQGKCPKEDAANLLCSSVARYARDSFGMDVLDEEADVAADEPVIIVANEMSEDSLRDIPNIGTKDPIILLCDRPPLDGGSSIFTKHTSTFIRKPCGPKKFARAVAFCLDAMYKSAPHRYGQQRTARHPSITAGNCDPNRNYAALPTPSALHTPFIDDDNSFFDPGGAYRRSSTIINPHFPKLLPDFTLLIPLQSPPNRPKPTVLAVEDNNINLMLLTTFLKKKGYPFEKATDGLDALVKYKNKPGGYDVILMDLQMPTMSGIESTREIRRYEGQRMISSGEPGRRRSFVVALTGLAAMSDQREAFEAGVDSFMVKPVNFRQLERTLEEGLG